jgi:hypothetical protein
LLGAAQHGSLDHVSRRTHFVCIDSRSIGWQAAKPVMAHLLPMRAFHSLLVALSLFCCYGTGAVAGEFYDRFLSLVDTNAPGALPVRSPLLTDTNNVAAKLTNCIVNLSNACSAGEIGGVRLGMTMEEVTALWGKPRYFHGRCFGGPNFSYEDVNVVFDPSRNSVMLITVKGARLDGGLSTESSAEQFESVLGNPVTRKERPNFHQLDLTYESARSTLRLSFFEGWLQYIQLERPSLDALRSQR